MQLTLRHALLVCLLQYVSLACAAADRLCALLSCMPCVEGGRAALAVGTQDVHAGTGRRTLSPALNCPLAASACSWRFRLSLNVSPVSLCAKWKFSPQPNCTAHTWSCRTAHLRWAAASALQENQCAWCKLDQLYSVARVAGRPPRCGAHRCNVCITSKAKPRGGTESGIVCTGAG